MKKKYYIRAALIAVLALICIASVLYVFAMNVPNPAKNGTVRYVGQPGIDMLEWNGRIYHPMDSWTAYPELKKGSYLGHVEGINELRAYKIKNDPFKDYLLVFSGGLIMYDQIIFAAVNPGG